MFNTIKKTRKAQVGSTVTWIVATIIIIFILLVTVFISNSLGKNKEINFSPERDTLASKSFFAWLLTNGDGGIIYGQLQEEENLNDLNGPLALDIFEEYYATEYSEVWVGIIFDRRISPFEPNDYFGHKPISATGGDVGGMNLPLLAENIYLNENKSIELVLKGR